jgi:hypothetical protein
MKIANIMALARPGRSRGKSRLGEGRCDCVRVCAAEKAQTSRDLPASCAVRRLLERSTAA